MYAYDFQDNQIPGEAPGAAGYWRDVGTLDAYYEAHMDLRAVSPSLNLYNGEWPLRTASYADPPAKFTFDDADRRGHAIDSIVSGGCILSGGMVRNSVLGRWVRVHSGPLVEDSVILDNCDIGRRAKIRRAILDKNVRIPEGGTIGYDLDQDRKYHHGHRDWHRRRGGPALHDRHLLPADLSPRRGASPPVRYLPPRRIAPAKPDGSRSGARASGTYAPVGEARLERLILALGASRRNRLERREGSSCEAAPEGRARGVVALR